MYGIEENSDNSPKSPKVQERKTEYGTDKLLI